MELLGLDFMASIPFWTDDHNDMGAFSDGLNLSYPDLVANVIRNSLVKWLGKDRQIFSRYHSEHYADIDYETRCWLSLESTSASACEKWAARRSWMFGLVTPSSRLIKLSRTYTHLHSRKIAMSESTFYTLKAERPGGKTLEFTELRGKTVLIVNVASAWYVLYHSLKMRYWHSYSGFTPQYKGMDEDTLSAGWLLK